jgi:type I restriction enzyme S subunit
MKPWPTKLLGEVCAINPKLAASEVPSADAEVTFVPMASVDEVSGVIAQPELRQCKQVVKGYTPFRENDVLFAKITPCMQNGKAAIVHSLRGGLGFGSTEFHVLRPSNGLLPEWVFALIRQPSFRLAAKASFTGSAGQQRVPTDFLKKFPIPMPPLPEQKRLVKLLNEVDELRKLRAQADQRTGVLISALFNEMFGGIDGSKKKWPMISLEEGCDFISGLWKGKKPPYKTIKVIRNTNFGERGVLDLEDVAVIDVESRQYEKRVLAAGDLILEKSGGSPSQPVGRVVLFKLEENGWSWSNFTSVIRIKDRTKISSIYLWTYLDTFYESGHTKCLQSQTTGIRNLNMTSYKALEIPLPPMPLQKEFAQRVTEIRELEAAQSSSRQRLDDLFQSMLHRAFNGEL